MNEPEHKHFIIRAEVKNVPHLKDLSYIENWMSRLIRDIEMEILIPPKAAYCDEINNEGITAIAAIKTSSLTFHCWDRQSPALIQFDCYSCKSFQENTVLRYLNEFGLIYYQSAILNRANVFTFIRNEGYGFEE